MQTVPDDVSRKFLYFEPPKKSVVNLSTWMEVMPFSLVRQPPNDRKDSFFACVHEQATLCLMRPHSRIHEPRKLIMVLLALSQDSVVFFVTENNMYDERAHTM